MVIAGFYIPPEPTYDLFAVLTESVILSPVGLTATNVQYRQNGHTVRRLVWAGPRLGGGGGGGLPMQYVRGHVYAQWQYTPLVLYSQTFDVKLKTIFGQKVPEQEKEHY
jgi:hypothetical protein